MKKKEPTPTISGKILVIFRKKHYHTFGTAILKAFLATLFLALFLLSVPAHADQFEDGKAAYDSRDYPTALKLWQPLADQGNADAQYWLGIMYTNGDGVPQDKAEATKWWVQAVNIWRPLAEKGDAKAEYKLAQMYDYGEGVAEDQLAAGEWYRKAADQGYPEAQWEVGQRYNFGRGVRQDKAEGEKWNQKALAQGYPHAKAWYWWHYFSDAFSFLLFFPSPLIFILWLVFAPPYLSGKFEPSNKVQTKRDNFVRAFCFFVPFIIAAPAHPNGEPLFTPVAVFLFLSPLIVWLWAWGRSLKTLRAVATIVALGIIYFVSMKYVIGWISLIWHCAIFLDGGSSCP